MPRTYRLLPINRTNHRRITIFFWILVCGLGLVLSWAGAFHMFMNSGDEKKNKYDVEHFRESLEGLWNILKSQNASNPGWISYNNSPESMYKSILGSGTLAEGFLQLAIYDQMQSTTQLLVTLVRLITFVAVFVVIIFVFLLYWFLMKNYEAMIDDDTDDESDDDLFQEHEGPSTHED